MSDSFVSTELPEIPEGDAKVIDTYPQADSLIQSGVQQFSRAVVDVVQQQVQSSTAELRTLDKVNHAVSAQYGELKDNLTEIEEFYQHYNEQVTALKPHLDSIDQLEKVVAQLEGAARVLDQQTKQLEVAIVDVLQ